MNSTASSTSVIMFGVGVVLLTAPAVMSNACNLEPMDAAVTQIDNLYFEASLLIDLRFANLAHQWHMETGGYSSVSQITSHPAYQEIIAMGDVVIPLILRDLQDNHGHWYTALRALVKPSPIPDADRGNMARMRAAWLSWGRDNGYVA